MANQNPEQIARDNIDKQLTACGWVIQSIKQVNLNAGIGVAVKEYLTDVGPADYVLFVEGKPCGVIEAKRVRCADLAARVSVKFKFNSSKRRVEELPLR